MTHVITINKILRCTHIIISNKKSNFIDVKFLRRNVINNVKIIKKFIVVKNNNSFFITICQTLFKLYENFYAIKNKIVRFKIIFYENFIITCKKLYIKHIISKIIL